MTVSVRTGSLLRTHAQTPRMRGIQFDPPLLKGADITEHPVRETDVPLNTAAVQMHLTQRAVRLDDTTTATPTLPSVGQSAPFSSTSTTRVSYAVRTEGGSKIYTLLYESCHSFRLNVGWNFLDETETVRYFFLIGL